MSTKPANIQKKLTKPEPIMNKETLMASTLVKDNQNFTSEQIGEIYDLFECFANPLTKLINMKDFVESLKVYGYEQNKSPIFRLLASISTGSEQPINFESFLLLLCQKIGHPSSIQGREAIFNLIDANQNNFITQEDIKSLADSVELNISEQDLKEIYMTFKKTKESSGITLEEFERYLISRLNLVTPISNRRFSELKYF